MKTYAETKKKEPFDWRKALSKPCGKMSLAEVDELCTMSEDWVTCACGNLCAVIPRDSEGKPKDTILADLGAHFHDAGISNMRLNRTLRRLAQANRDRRCALEILAQIEARAAGVIAATLAKKKGRKK